MTKRKTTRNLPLACEAFFVREYKIREAERKHDKAVMSFVSEIIIMIAVFIVPRFTLVCIRDQF